jgi:thioesterase domain-containing protein/predicted acylesterase/phospholipase RssA/acyl-CoA synthetase (AMP-forming)/AMP-acid ligase II/tetratricopeptide (TPR) repeat protein
VGYLENSALSFLITTELLIKRIKMKLFQNKESFDKLSKKNQEYLKRLDDELEKEYPLLIDEARRLLQSQNNESLENDSVHARNEALSGTQEESHGPHPEVPRRRKKCHNKPKDILSNKINLDNIANLDSECHSFDSAGSSEEEIDDTEEFRMKAQSAGPAASLQATRIDKQPLEKHGTKTSANMLPQHIDPLSSYDFPGFFHQKFESIVDSYPNQVALSCERTILGEESSQLTYQKLEFYANKIAHFLHQLRLKPESRIGLFLEEPYFSIAIIGTWKAGLACIPLNSHGSTEHLRSIIENCQPALILTEDVLSHHYIIGECLVNNTKVSMMERIFSFSTDKEGNQRLNLVLSPPQLAYVLYGSNNNKPKGVAVEQYGLMNSINTCILRLSITSVDRIVLLNDVDSNMGLMERLQAYAIGASTYRVPNEKPYDFISLSEYCQSKEITVAIFTLKMLNELNPACFLTLRAILLVEAKISKELLSRWVVKLPSDQVRQLINVYCPPEVGVCTSLYKYTNPVNNMPIGKPILGLEVFVLPKNLTLIDLQNKERVFQPLPEGEEGELYVVGASISRGYWDELILESEENFLTLNIKKIEKQNLLQTYRCYRTKDRGYIKNEVIYITGRSTIQKKNVEVLKTASIPVIKRNSQFWTNKLVRRVAKSWCDVLKTNRSNLSETNNFLHLGGTSIKFTSIIQQVSEEFPSAKEIVYNDFLQDPSFKGLVRRLQQYDNQSLPIYCLVAKDEKKNPPLFLIPGITGDGKNDFNVFKDHWHSETNQSLYTFNALQFIIINNDFLSIEEIASNYLRAIKKVQPVGPYFLCGYLLGGTIAYEIACQLQVQEEIVAVLLIDSISPQMLQKIPKEMYVDFVLKWGAYLSAWIGLSNCLLPSKQELVNFNSQEQLCKIIERIKISIQDVNSHIRDTEQACKQMEIVQALALTQFNYIPQYWVEHLIIIKTDMSGGLKQSQDLGWLVQNQQVIELSGSSFSILNQREFVKKIIKELGRLIQQQKIKLKAILQKQYGQRAYLEIPLLLGETLPINSCYINLTIVKHEAQAFREYEGLSTAKERTHIITSYEAIYSLENKEFVPIQNIFNPPQTKLNKAVTISNSPRRILILGRAGIGKTILLKHYIPVMWARGELWAERFDWVICIQLRQLNNTKYPPNTPLLEIIKQEILPTDLARLSNEALTEWLHYGKSRTLFLLDGLDEFNLESMHCSKAIRELLEDRDRYIILSSRPSSFSLTLSVDLMLENIGFTDTNVAKYARRYFNEFFERNNQEKNNIEQIQKAKITTDQFLDYLKQNHSIYGLAHVPVNLQLLCFVWEDIQLIINDGNYLTLTTLYITMSHRLWLRYILRPEIKSRLESHYKDLLTSEETAKDITPEQLKPMVNFENAFLEELAYRGIETDQVMLDKTLVDEILQSLTMNNQEINFALFGNVEKSSGFITTAKKADLPEKNRQYYFIHRTFQEFFAAKYWVYLFTSNNEKCYEKACEILIRNKLNPQYEFVWWFVAGLLDKNYFDMCKKFFELLMSDPQDSLNIYLPTLAIRCLHECENWQTIKDAAKIISTVISLTKWALEQDVEYGNYLLKFLAQIWGYCPRIYLQSDMQTLLINNLQLSVNENVRECSLQLIGNIGIKSKNIVDNLLLCFQSEDFRMTGYAAEALGKINASDEKVIKTLLDYLETNHETYERWKRYNIVEALIKVCKNPFKALIQFIQAVTDEGYGTDQEPDEGYRHEMAKSIKNWQEEQEGGEINREILEKLNTPEMPINTKAALLYILSKKPEMEDTIFKIAMSILKKYDLSQFEDACYAISKLKWKSTYEEPLVKLVKQTKNIGIRIQLCQLLPESILVRENLLDFIVKRLREIPTSEEYSFREYYGSSKSILHLFSWLLKQSSTTSNFSFLIPQFLEYLKDTIENNRVDVVDILACIGKNNLEVAERLIAMENDSSQNVLNSVCRALGKIGVVNDEIIEFLIRFMQIDYTSSNACRSIAIFSFQDNSKLKSCLNKILDGTLFFLRSTKYKNEPMGILFFNKLFNKVIAEYLIPYAFFELERDKGGLFAWDARDNKYAAIEYLSGFDLTQHLTMIIGQYSRFFLINPILKSTPMANILAFYLAEPTAERARLALNKALNEQSPIFCYEGSIKYINNGLLSSIQIPEDKKQLITQQFQQSANNFLQNQMSLIVNSTQIQNMTSSFPSTTIAALTTSLVPVIIKPDLKVIKDILKKAKEYKQIKEPDTRILLEIYGFALALSRYVDNQQVKVEIEKKITKAIKGFVFEKLSVRKDIELANFVSFFNALQQALELLRLEAKEQTESNSLNLDRFFEKTQKEFEKIINDLFEYTHGVLGKPPCRYVMLSVGSLATRMVTPYSDIEYIVLVDKTSDAATTYFTNFADLVEMMLIGFGESPIYKAEAILAEFKDYFSYIRKGSRMDEHKRPQDLNRQFGLITTSDELLSVIPKKLIHESGNHLTAALLTTSCFDKGSDEDLYAKHQRLFETALIKPEYVNCLEKLLSQGLRECTAMRTKLKTHMLKKELDVSVELKHILLHPIHLIRLYTIYLKAKGHPVILTSDFFATLNELKNKKFIDAVQYQQWQGMIKTLLPERLKRQTSNGSAEAKVSLSDLNVVLNVLTLCQSLEKLTEVIETELHSKQIKRATNEDISEKLIKTSTDTSKDITYEPPKKSLPLENQLQKEITLQVDPNRWYRDDDISSYVDLIVRKELGDYKKETTANIATTGAQTGTIANYLLFGIGDSKFPGENDERYYVAVTPAIDTASLASPIDFYFDKSRQQAPDTGKRDDRRDVFDELLPCLLSETNCLAKILFPYNLTQSHWLTGEVTIDKQGHHYEIKILAHDPFGGGQVTESNFNVIKAAIEKRIRSGDEKDTFQFQRANSPYKRRQALGDSTSCGVIACEDILKRISGASLNQTKPYDQGTKDLREKHVDAFVKYLKETDATRVNFVKRNTVQQKNVGLANQMDAQEGESASSTAIVLAASLSNQLMQQRKEAAKKALELVNDIESEELREILLTALRNSQLYDDTSDFGHAGYILGIRTTLINRPVVIASRGESLSSQDILVINRIYTSLFTHAGYLQISLQELYPLIQQNQYVEDESFYNVPEQVECFIGRDDFLGKIRECFSNDKRDVITQAISGLGGVGKTQVVLAYANHHRKDYQDRIRWIQAANIEKLKFSYREFAKALRVDVKDDDAIRVKVQEKIKVLPTTLFIFDNAEGETASNPDGIKNLKLYLPPKDSQFTHHVLITSRKQGWENFAKSLVLNEFEEKYAVDFILTILKDKYEINESAKEAIKLVTILGCLPLALVQAVRVIADLNGIKGYFNHYESIQSREKLLNERPFHDKYEETIFRIVSITIQKIPKEAVEVLKLCAYLDPDEIPLEVFREWIRLKGFELYELMRSLYSYLLVIRGPINSFRVHRLVQEVIRIKLLEEKSSAEYIKEALILVNKAYNYDSTKMETVSYSEKFLSSASAILNHVKYSEVTQEVLEISDKILEKIVNYYLTHRQSASTEIEKHCDNLLQIRKKLFGTENHIEIVNVYNHYGELLYYQSYYKESCKYFEKSIYILKNIFTDDNSPIVPRTKSDYADVLSKLGHFKKSEALHREALAIQEKYFPMGSKDNDIEMATTLHALANVLDNQKQYEESITLYKKSLNILGKYYGQNHHRVGRTLNALGQVYLKYGSIEEAEKCLKIALNIQKQIHANRPHSDMAKVLRSLGKLAFVRSHYEEAKEYYNQGLAIQIELYPKRDHPQIGKTNYFIGEILEKEANLLEAKKYYNIADEIFSVKFSEEHPDRINCAKKLANIKSTSKQLNINFSHQNQGDSTMQTPKTQAVSTLLRDKKDLTALTGTLILHKPGQVVLVEDEQLNEILQNNILNPLLQRPQNWIDKQSQEQIILRRMADSGVADEAVIKTLNEYKQWKAKTDNYGNNLFHWLAITGRINLAHAFKTNAVKMDEENQFGLPPVHMSVVFNQTTILNFFADFGFSNYKTKVSYKSLNGETHQIEFSPFHLAVFLGREEQVGWYLNHRDDIELDVVSFGNVFHLAVCNGQTAVLKLLLTHPAVQKIAKVSALLQAPHIIEKGLSVLSYAAAENRPWIVYELMRAYRTDSSLQGSRLEQAQKTLIEAVRHGALESVYMLLDLDVNANFNFDLKEGKKKRNLSLAGFAQECLNEEKEGTAAHQRQDDILTHVETASRGAYEKRYKILDMNQRHVRNLVFQGGGIKGLAYVGAYKAFCYALPKQSNNLNAIQHIERVAGTSAGAIFAAALALGFSAEQLAALMADAPFARFLDDIKPAVLREAGFWNKAKGLFDDMVNLGGQVATFATHPLLYTQRILSAEGLSKGEVIMGWLSKIMTEHLLAIRDEEIKKDKPNNLVIATINSIYGLEESAKITIDEVIKHGLKENQLLKLTFGQLNALVRADNKRFKHLYTVALRLQGDNQNDDGKKEGLEVMHSQGKEGSGWEWPRVLVIDAIRASMSIPMAFVPHQVRECNEHGKLSVHSDNHYVDGGALKNFPIELFDRFKYLPSFAHGAHGDDEKPESNPFTIGFRLVTPETTDKQKDVNGLLKRMEDKLGKLLGQVQEGIERNTAIGFLQDFMSLYYHAEDIIAEFQNVRAGRTIEMSNGGISTLHFNLSADERNGLIANGEKAVQQAYKDINFSGYKTATVSQAGLIAGSGSPVSSVGTNISSSSSSSTSATVKSRQSEDDDNDTQADAEQGSSNPKR